MRKTRFFVQAFVALAVLAIPAWAAAQPYPFVHPAMGNSQIAGMTAGTALDPTASKVRIVPPKNGYVVLYRGQKAKGWFFQPGLATVNPRQVYGVVAMRGTSVLFHSGIMFRPGITDLVWRGSSNPKIAYQPFYRYPGTHLAAHPSAPFVHHGHHNHHDGQHGHVQKGSAHHVSSHALRQAARRHLVTRTRNRQLLGQMAGKAHDSQKFHIAQEFWNSHTFQPNQVPSARNPISKMPHTPALTNTAENPKPTVTVKQPRRLRLQLGAALAKPKL